MFFCMMGLPHFGKEGPGTPDFKILVRALGPMMMLTYYGRICNPCGMLLNSTIQILFLYFPEYGAEPR